MLPGAMAVYLASPRGEFLRGKTIEANWDVEDMEERADVISTKDEAAELGPPAPLTVGLAGRSGFPGYVS